MPPQKPRKPPKSTMGDATPRAKRAVASSKKPRKAPLVVPAFEEVDDAVEVVAPLAVVDDDEVVPNALAVVDDDEVVPNPKAVALAPRREGVVTRGDPLAAYLAEVNRHSLLSRDEETALARQYRATADVKAAYRLVASNLRLVVKLAHEYHRNPISLLDLIQEGNIGLMQAVKKFDPDRGAKLSSYAAWWIRAYILRFIMDNWKMVKVGTTEAQRRLFFKLRQEQERLASQGFEVTAKLLAERLNVTEAEVVEMDQRLGRDELSLDAPSSPNDDESRGDRLESKTPSAENVLADEQLKSIFRERLGTFAKTLGDKDRYLFDKRLMADQPLTLQDIGAQWGVSRERVRQIEGALLDRIRTHMRQEIPDFDLIAVEERHR